MCEAEFIQNLSRVLSDSGVAVSTRSGRRAREARRGRRRGQRRRVRRVGRVGLEERGARDVLRVQRRLGEFEHWRHARVERLVHSRPLVARALAEEGRDALTELGEPAGTKQSTFNNILVFTFIYQKIKT